MFRAKSVLLATLATTTLASGALAQEAASRFTIDANRRVAASLPVDDGEDESFATRGFAGTWDEPQLKDASGRVIWNFADLDSLKGAAPDTVNPSLWRQAKLLAHHGLYKISDRVWQVRGFDVANMTIIEGDTGLIVIDPLTSVEAATAALKLARRHIGNKAVKAVLYTHSHQDHFGGVRGIVDQADVDAGRVQIIAPKGFMEHVVSEAVVAGNAMGRRSSYQFGFALPYGPTGTVGSGVGPAITLSSASLIPPTADIDHTGQAITIDGVAIEFQLTPGTEAPAEMNIFFPQLRTLCLAENANATMHNVLTPRGALVRDAKAWADYLTESLNTYGGRSDYLVLSHTWPRFGGDRIRNFIASQRDAYKLLHDQSVRLMNTGLTSAEIAEKIALPPSLGRQWFNRGYYGTMSHNSKAVYQRYMGWYDGNPAHLNPLPQEEAGRRYVAALGGSDRVIALGDQAMAAGEYRWAAELLDRLVMSDPANAKARERLAETHIQMGYQAESAIWRNMYLMAARELRAGVQPIPGPSQSAGQPDLIASMTSSMFFDLMAVQLDPAKAGDTALSIRFVFPERKEDILVTIRNGVLIHEPANGRPADAVLTMPRLLFLQMLDPRAARPAAMSGAKVEGNLAAIAQFRTLFSPPDSNFAIVTP